jgi:hypothetical protein
MILNFRSYGISLTVVQLPCATVVSGIVAEAAPTDAA